MKSDSRWAEARVHKPQHCIWFRLWTCSKDKHVDNACCTLGLMTQMPCCNAMFLLWLWERHLTSFISWSPSNRIPCCFRRQFEAQRPAVGGTRQEPLSNSGRQYDNRFQDQPPLPSGPQMPGDSLTERILQCAEASPPESIWGWSACRDIQRIREIARCLRQCQWCKQHEGCWTALW